MIISTIINLIGCITVFYLIIKFGEFLINYFENKKNDKQENEYIPYQIRLRLQDGTYIDYCKCNTQAEFEMYYKGKRFQNLAIVYIANIDKAYLYNDSKNEYVEIGNIKITRYYNNYQNISYL